MAHKKPAPPAGLGTQGRNFIEAARSLECDESEERFNESLAKLARQKPSPSKPKESKNPTK